MLCDAPSPARGMKLLYVPNEERLGDQVGPRDALDWLTRRGDLGGLSVFSWRVRARQAGCAQQAQAELLEVARKFQPDLVLFQHVADFPVLPRFVRQVRALPCRPTIAYHEGDVFGRLIKPFPRPMKVVAAASDIVFTVGLGDYARRFIRYGAPQVAYSPSCVDTVRFGTAWAPPLRRRWDAVMIGNRIACRWPALNRFAFARMSGSLQREQLVRRLGEELGGRFAVFGQGWSKFPGNGGAVPFDEQERVMRQAWLTVSWNHFWRVPCFFSNRLPISLASGVAHVTNYQPGYECLFENGRHLVWARSVKEMVTSVRALLGLGPRRLIELGQQGQELALANLSARAVYASMIRRAAEHRLAAVRAAAQPREAAA